MTAWGGQALFGPNWKPQVTPTTFPLNSVGINVLETGAQPFARIIGRQIIRVIESPTSEWSIQVDGGWNAVSGGYLTSYDNLSNYYYISNSGVNVERVVTNQDTPLVAPNQMMITTTGGRTYTMMFSRFPGVRPVLSKSPVNPLTETAYLTVTTFL